MLYWKPLIDLLRPYISVRKCSPLISQRTYQENLIPHQAILPWLITSFFLYNDDGYMSDKDFKTVKPPTSKHPKCEDLVVAYENRTTGGLFRVEVLTFLLFGREFIACNF